MACDGATLTQEVLYFMVMHEMIAKKIHDARASGSVACSFVLDGRGCSHLDHYLQIWLLTAYIRRAKVNLPS